MPVYLNRIQYLEQQINSSSSSDSSSTESKIALWEEIISVSKLAIEKIDQNELLKYLGEKSSEASTLSDEVKKDLDNKKGWIVELLVHQGTALIERTLLVRKASSSTNENASVEDELRNVYRALQRWIDINDDKVSKFTLKLYQFMKLNGKALKLLFKQLEEKQAGVSKSIEQQILSTLQELNLQYAYRTLSNHVILRYQPKYASY
jgi:hypothetical protein